MGGLPQLRIRLLGGLTVEGLDERRIGSRKGRTVLKLLALARGGPVPVDRVADVLWGDELPSRPVDQVGVLVSRLRAVLGSDRLPRTDAGYALHADWLDLDELEDRVAEAERRRASGPVAAARAAAEAALALVRGPLLPEEDGDWVELERVAVERLASRARLALAEAAVDAGDPGAAVAAAESILDGDPYDEGALRALMRGHVSAGRPASALAAYARVRERLAEDLGVFPDVETEALREAIVVGQQASPAASRRRGPSLAGRDRELAILEAALNRAAGGETALVVIDGEAGIGKTALLDAAAASAADRGMAVFRCAADVLGRDLPLQPLLDGLARELRSRGAELAAAVLGPDATMLEPLLGRQVPSTTTSATVLSDAEAGRAALFAALASALNRLASDRPLLLIADDLHLADAATVEFLRFTARRAQHTAIFAGCRLGHHVELRTAQIVRLGVLDLDAAEAIVGSDRAAELHARSGGNPLFLVELARSPDALPVTILESVGRRADALGESAARTLRAAAVLGPYLDLDLLAEVAGRPLAQLLDETDAAARAGLLTERGASYALAHDLVREALAAGVSAARRAFLHREAARVLAGRPGADPKAVAWHARHGGQRGTAATALAAAAAQASQRFDHDEAERLLEEALELQDDAGLRLSRARVRLARWDIAGANEDARKALELGAGDAGYEVAGWVNYYARDYVSARRYADEGAERADDDAIRASCLALAGRIRHARGALAEAEPRLVEAARCRVVEVRGVAQAWLSTLRVHQGHPEEAAELAERALLEPDRLAHPFTRFHGRFSLAMALGMEGRVHDALMVVDRLHADAERAGEQGVRYLPVALNLRSWPLRAVGRFSEALEVADRAAELSEGDNAALAEPRHVSMLDRADTLLWAGDLDAAAAALDRTEPLVDRWDGTMAWRAKHRLRLLRAGLALAVGELERAEGTALALAEGAEAAGNVRHAVLARCVAAAAAGRRTDPQAVEGLLTALDRCAGLEAWAITARLAAACGIDRWRADAERRARALVAAAGPLSDDARRYVDRSLSSLARPR